MDNIDKEIDTTTLELWEEALLAFRAGSSGLGRFKHALREKIVTISEYQEIFDALEEAVESWAWTMCKRKRLNDILVKHRKRRSTKNKTQTNKESHDG
jgi:dissimilatory sulfite reductase (desulfoviridin) alpha/beta subunit